MDRLEDEREAASILRLKVKTLQEWRRLLRGPRFVRLGRRVFYPRGELEQFIQSNLVETDGGRGKGPGS